MKFVGRNMSFGIRDLIYIIVYVLSLAGVFNAFKNRLKNLEREVRKGYKILYADRGQLNLIDQDTCKKYRDEVFTAIRRSERIIEMLLDKLEKINENMIIIMVHMGINSPNGIKKD